MFFNEDGDMECKCGKWFTILFGINNIKKDKYTIGVETNLYTKNDDIYLFPKYIINFGVKLIKWEIYLSVHFLTIV